MDFHKLFFNNLIIIESSHYKYGPKNIIIHNPIKLLLVLTLFANLAKLNQNQ
jgi:hypothetical protein